MTDRESNEHQQLFKEVFGEYRQINNKEGFLKLEELCQESRAKVLEAIMLLAKSGKESNPRQLLLQLSSYEAIAENKISAEWFRNNMPNFVELVLTAFSNGTRADDRRVTTEMMTFFYRAVSRFKDKQKRKKQERREGETAQEVIPEQQDDTDQYE